MSYRTSIYAKCDFCSNKSHAYADKRALHEYVFESAVYPWKEIDGKHKCHMCLKRDGDH